MKNEMNPNNNVAEGNEPTNEKLFSVPLGIHLPELAAVAEAADFDFAAFQEVEAQRVTLSVDELRTNLRTLAPAALATLPETITFEGDYTFAGSMEATRGNRVQISPLLMQFTLNALALYGVEQGSNQALSVSVDDVPALEAAHFDSKGGLEPEDWQDASSALNFSASFASASHEGTGCDWASDVEEAQETIQKLRKAQGALRWCLDEFNDLAVRALKDRNEDVKGYAEILGVPVVEVAAAESLQPLANAGSDDLADPAIESAPAGPGEPPKSPVAVVQGADDEGPDWKAIAAALKQLGDYAESIPDGEEVQTTANFFTAVPCHRVFVLIRKFFPHLERVFLGAIEEEIRYAKVKVQDYALLKELDNPNFDAINGSSVA